MILSRIEEPTDLKQLSLDELKILSEEIRNILIKKASSFGGHLASNLGSIELTVALHYVFDESDKIVFDVSHQCYTHKILTGRKQAFLDEKEYDTVTGFTNPLESPFDLFNIGHTSTSISLASGLAKARDLNKSSENIIAVIGDAALDGGEAFEALNYIGESKTKVIIIVNDNHMSIPENHGFLNEHLNELYMNNGITDKNLFEDFGFEYYLVRDGHDINALIEGFKKAKYSEKPVVVHCRTIKGKGYKPAELNQEKWHHAHPFNIATGEYLKQHSVPQENYGSIVGDFLINKIKKNKKVIAMTASVPACFGFDKKRRIEAGENFIDVGICEQHMISMAVGLSKSGLKPVLITESSFYQRAYDQIEQEMCINKAPVTLLVAFSGIFGHNDNTHIGFYDISLFGNIPNMVYLAPTNKEDYLSMLEWSINQSSHPVAIRIPWNGVYHSNAKVLNNYSITKYRINHRGEKVAIIGLGSFYQLGQEVASFLKLKSSIEPTLIDPIFITGLDFDCLNNLKNNHQLIVTLEDGLVRGGFGSKISQYYSSSEMKVLNYGFGSNIPAKFSRIELMENNRLTKEKIVEDIVNILHQTSED